MQDERKFLRNGEAFKQSLRDDRHVIYQGERVEDVTTHFAMAGGISQVAQIYDEQSAGEHDELLTYRRSDGYLAASAYMPPRCKHDLVLRRCAIGHVAKKTWGTHCRSLDMIASFAVGMLGYVPSFARQCPEYAANIAGYHDHAERNSLYLSEAIVDPQGFRARSSATPTHLSPPDRAVMRITRQDNDGIWISGIKGVGTVAPQSNEIFVGSLFPALPDEAFWAYVPVNADGVRIFCRAAVSRPHASAYDHPLTSLGEEAEAMVVFDNVFIPRWRIMAARVPALGHPAFFNLWTSYSHWYTLVRLETKADLYAGLAKVVLEVLGLESIPVVRQRVSEIVQFAEILRGMCTASIETATLSEGDILLPGPNALAAGRVFAMEKLPRVLHLLRELCGQGLILRFDQRDLDADAAFGQKFSWFLDTQSVNAKQKNLLMNLVWDVAASEHAMRALVFEEQHALSEPLLRDRLVQDYDYRMGVELVHRTIGLHRG